MNLIQIPHDHGAYFVGRQIFLGRGTDIICSDLRKAWHEFLEIRIGKIVQRELCDRTCNLSGGLEPARVTLAERRERLPNLIARDRKSVV